MENPSAWRRAAFTYLAVGLLAAVAYFLVPGGGLVQAALFIGLNASAVLALLLGVRRHRPRARRAWCLVAAGEGFLIVGNIVWFVQRVALEITVPFPSLGDVFYLTAFPFFALGVARLIRPHEGERASALDGFIVFLGTGAVSWVFLIAPQWRDEAVSTTGRLIALAYPLMDLVLFAVVARVLATRPGRTFSYRALLLGSLVTVAGDTSYALALAHGSYYVGSPIDAGWLLSYVLVGAAGLHPTMRSPVISSSDEATSRWRPLILAAAALAAPIALVTQVAWGRLVDTLVVAAVCVALFALVLVRAWQLGMDLAERRRREEALQREATLVGMLQIATAAANEARSLEAAVRSVVERICELLGSQLGRGTVLEPGRHSEITVKGQGPLSPSLPGHSTTPPADDARNVAARTLAPIWIWEAGAGAGASSNGGAREALPCGFAFPVVVGGQAVAVFEFFGPRPLDRHPELLDVAADMGIQLGRVVEREQLGKAQRELRSLSDRLIDERERERTRIAGDLHDLLLQDLAALQLEADNLTSALKVEDGALASDLAATMKRQVAEIIRDVRRAISDLLRPGLQDGNIVEAMSRFARSFHAETGIEVDERIDQEAAEGLPLPLALLLYECCQEALTNVARHAEASRVEVRLAKVGRLVELRVRDDGRGPSGIVFRDRHGLALTRDKVTLVGGGVWFDRRSERGADLIVRLPAPASAVCGEAEASRVPAGPEPAPPSLPPHRS